MSEPLKDLGRLAADPGDHRILTRIANARGITLQELVREVLGAYVRKAIHDAKVVLGQDEGDGKATEDDGSRRSARNDRR